ncbi:antitoxin MazE-like protein [Salinarimonas sp. NSM]|uniref:antitoxin MazE-like protein n=1 Tax=Salinarimonas sp. NSM TaxID=3458003 RepID=UPI00403585A1
MSGSRRERERHGTPCLREAEAAHSGVGAGGFAEECRRRSLIVAAADAADDELAAFMDAALADVTVDDESDARSR